MPIAVQEATDLSDEVWPTVNARGYEIPDRRFGSVSGLIGVRSSCSAKGQPSTNLTKARHSPIHPSYPAPTYQSHRHRCWDFRYLVGT